MLQSRLDAVSRDCISQEHEGREDALVLRSGAGGFPARIRSSNNEKRIQASLLTVQGTGRPPFRPMRTARESQSDKESPGCAVILCDEDVQPV